MNAPEPATPTAIAQQYETAAQRAVKFANAFTIESDEDYQNACAELVAVKTRGNAVEAERVKITGPLNAALQAANDLFRGPKNLFASVEGIWKAKLLVWQQKQAAIADAARRLAEQAAQKEREALAALADEQAKAGRVEEAEATRAAAEVTVAHAVVAAMPRGRGVATAKGLDFGVHDKFAFVKFVVDEHERDKGLLDFVNVDMVKLRQAVATHGKSLNWPGLTITDKSTVRVRT